MDVAFGQAVMGDRDARFALRVAGQQCTAGCRHVRRTLTMRGTRRSIDLLVHPNREPPTADDANRHDRPDKDRQYGEYQQFRHSSLLADHA